MSYPPGKGKYSAMLEGDQDTDYFSMDETPPPGLPSPKLLDTEDEDKPVIPDDTSDASWEAESVPKSAARKSSRPKIAPRPHVPDYDGPLRKRGVRCMECPACMRKDDCGQCEMCRDKKKFGGPGVKKQACMYVLYVYVCALLYVQWNLR